MNAENDDRIFLNAEMKRKLIGWIWALPERLYHFGMSPARPVHTDKQSGYYWGAIVPAFAKVLRQHDAELTIRESLQLAHKSLMQRGGEIIGFAKTINDEDGVYLATWVPSYRTLNIEQTSKLIEWALDWLAKDWHVEVMPSEMWLQLHRPNELRSKRVPASPRSSYENVLKKDSL